MPYPDNFNSAAFDVAYGNGDDDTAVTRDDVKAFAAKQVGAFLPRLRQAFLATFPNMTASDFDASEIDTEYLIQMVEEACHSAIEERV